MSTAVVREGRGLAHWVIGSARVVAFGVSGVAPAGSMVGGLVILVSYAVNVFKQNRIPDSGAAFFDMVVEPAV